jgi:hypothetical protein
MCPLTERASQSSKKSDAERVAEKNSTDQRPEKLAHSTTFVHAIIGLKTGEIGVADEWAYSRLLDTEG